VAVAFLLGAGAVCPELRRERSLQLGRAKEDVVKRLAILPALPLLLASLASAQQPASSEGTSQQPAPAPQGTVFRSGANLVPLNVTVTDHSRQFVKGLTKADFSVFEDGVEQSVQFFEAAETPLDLILLIDTSSSMSDKMDVVHEAAIGFLKTMKAGDRGAVVAFADGVDIIQPLTGDRAALEEGIQKTKARGATSLNNALYISLKQFGRGAQHQGDVRRQAIAVLSDGEDTSSLVSFDDVLELARKSGVSIYPIVLQSKYAATRTAAQGQRRYFSESEYSMRTLAQETGAQAFFPMQIYELKSVYAAIGEELSSQYSLAYSPANTRTDGRFRRITVRVDKHPELKLRTRTGYTAALPRPAAPASFAPER
jgi:Ca-activated chloride channel family protein